MAVAASHQVGLESGDILRGEAWKRGKKIGEIPEF